MHAYTHTRNYSTANLITSLVVYTFHESIHVLHYCSYPISIAKDY